MAADRIPNKTLISILVVVAALEVLGGKLLKGLSPLSIIGVLRFLEGGGILLIFLYFHRSVRLLSLSPATLKRGVYRGMLWSAAFGAAALAAGLILFAAGVTPIAGWGSPLFPNQALSLFVVGGLIGPLAEELFFRGVIYSYFRPWGSGVAVLVSTVLFVLPHTGAGIPVVQLVGGVLFALSFELEKNLMVPMLLHILGNSAIFFISFVTH